MRRQKLIRGFIVGRVESSFRTIQNTYEVIDTQTGQIEDYYPSYDAALSAAANRNRSAGVEQNASER
jgi:hypothetical protein